jgi:hypothetical protein
MSRPHDPVPFDLYAREIQERIAQQEALVRRTIVQGTLTQAAEDRLQDLQRTLRSMKQRPVCAAETQRRMRDRRT